MSANQDQQNVMDENISSAEARILGTHLGTVQSDMREVKNSVDEINESLKVLVKLEVQYAETHETLKRSFDAINKGDERQTKIDERVQVIERDMPGLKEARVWIIAVAGGAVCMMLLAIASLVLRPATVVYSQPPPVTNGGTK